MADNSNATANVSASAPVTTVPDNPNADSVEVNTANDLSINTSTNDDIDSANLTTIDNSSLSIEQEGGFVKSEKNEISSKVESPSLEINVEG